MLVGAAERSAIGTRNHTFCAFWSARTKVIRRWREVEERAWARLEELRGREVDLLEELGGPTTERGARFQEDHSFADTL